MCTLRRLGKIEIGKLLGELMSHYGDEHGHIGDKVYFKRILDLIDQGEIKMENSVFDVQMYDTVIWV